MNRLVSVIIPTFGGAEKIDRAIKSVLAQTYENIEVIVVDDNDPNSMHRLTTIRKMNQYNQDQRVRYIQHEYNKNGAAARNTGISKVKGEFICFLDDDDFIFPDRIKKSVEILNRNSDYQGVYCSVVLTCQNNIVGLVRANKPIEQEDILLNEMVIGTGSNIFIKTDAIKSIGGFDEKFIRHQDLEFMIRILSSYKVINLEEVLIVKATNGINNIPNYKKMEKVKEMYFEKFEREISNLNKREKKEFYAYNYTTLLQIAILNKDKNEIKNAVKKVKTIRRISLKETIYIFMIRIGFYDTRCYRFIIKILKSMIKFIKSKRNIVLSTDQLEYIKNFLKEI